LEQIRPLYAVNMLKHLDIRLEELGDDFLVGSMPVDERTQQPFGILHGGATCVLAETLGSIAANLVLNPDQQYAVGLDINANHLRSIRTGRVKGVARPIHLGQSTQVWEINVYDEQERKTAVTRLTMSVLKV
jgi:1,4-dihydroxy-2-naphthoyl-CoA hydrolase